MIYLESKGGWRWQYEEPAGKILAYSANSFPSRDEARAHAMRFGFSAPLDSARASAETRDVKWL